MQKTAETGRFQRSFRFCRTRFSLLFCALDFDQKILNQGDRKMKKIKMNQERLWKPISSTCAPYPSTRAFRKAMRTTAASVSLRASSSASHMRLPVRFSQGHIQTGRHPLKTSILHKLSQGALWRMEVFLLFPSSRQNRTQSVSLSVWLSNRCSLSWVLRRSWPPHCKGRFVRNLSDAAKHEHRQNIKLAIPGAFFDDLQLVPVFSSYLAAGHPLLSPTSRDRFLSCPLFLVQLICGIYPVRAGQSIRKKFLNSSKFYSLFNSRFPFV